jgi:hypothetical protein
MDRPTNRNPIVVSSSQQVPSEQDTYATASLGRAMAHSEGKVTHERLPGVVTSDPPSSDAQLTQVMFLGVRLSS